MSALSVDWSEVADQSVKYRSRRYLSIGTHHFPFGLLRLEDGAIGIAAQDVTINVLPRPSRTMFCNGRPYTEYGRPTPPEILIGRIIAPRNIAESFLEAFAIRPGFSWPNLVLTVASGGDLLNTGIILEKAMLQGMGSEFGGQDMLLLDSLSLIAVNVHTEETDQS